MFSSLQFMRHLCNAATKQTVLHVRACNSSNISRQLTTQLTSNGRVLIVKADNDAARHEMQFPTIWLRDNCQCTDCFHATTMSRQINWERCNSIGVRATKITGNNDQKTIAIEWSDEHSSEFNLSWLQERDFAQQRRRTYLHEFYKPKEVTWNNENFSAARKEFDFESIFKNDRDLFNCLESLAVYGFCFIKNSPHDKTVVQQLADSLGFIKKTPYGEVFEVKSKENAYNYAYLMKPLPLHIDVPYYEYIAGINILHCLEQSLEKGGENLLTDGFYVAEQLRTQYPKYFEILKTVPVNWFDVGKEGDLEYHNIWREPVINLDIDGRLHRINHNTMKRDSHFTVPLDIVDLWYKAYDKFLEISQESAVEFKTKPGMVFIFNNRRMLHGRRAYMDTPTNKRHMIGAYVDWDVLYSKYRLLKVKLSEEKGKK